MLGKYWKSSVHAARGYIGKLKRFSLAPREVSRWAHTDDAHAVYSSGAVNEIFFAETRTPSLERLGGEFGS